MKTPYEILITDETRRRLADYPETLYGPPPGKAKSELPPYAGAQTKGACGDWSTCAALIRGSSAGSAPETWQTNVVIFSPEGCRTIATKAGSFNTVPG